MNFVERGLTFKTNEAGHFLSAVEVCASASSCWRRKPYCSDSRYNNLIFSLFFDGSIL
jgi:hypothetical protein